MHSGHGYSPSKAATEAAFGESSFSSLSTASAFGRMNISTKRSVRSQKFDQSLRPAPGSLCTFVTHYSESTGPCYKPSHLLTEKVPPRTKIGEEKQRGDPVSWSRDRSLASTGVDVGPGKYEASSSMDRQVASVKKSCARPKFGQDETRRNDPIEKKNGQGEFGTMPGVLGSVRRGVKKNAPVAKFGGSERHFWIPKTGCF